jgi:hypothetical protein
MKRVRQLVVVAVLSTITVGVARAALPLAPLSSLGKLTAAPSPGPAGPEVVPIPKGAILQNPSPPKLNQTVDGVTCQSTEKVVFHIHAHLTIFVNGKAKVIPYAIGIGPPGSVEPTTAGMFVTAGRCFMWLHTHAEDGVIHIEAPKQMTFTLAQFFAVWGAKLSRKQVGPATGKVTAFYNGKVWTGALGAIPLTSEAQIQLDVGKPLIAPEHIVFPAGLAASTTKSK